MILDYEKRAKLVEHLNNLLAFRRIFLGNDQDDCMDHSSPFQTERNYYKGPIYLHIYGILRFTIPISDDQLTDIAKQVIDSNIERANEIQECFIIKDV